MRFLYLALCMPRLRRLVRDGLRYAPTLPRLLQPELRPTRVIRLG